jgi:hypothetical protein
VLVGQSFPLLRARLTNTQLLTLATSLVSAKLKRLKAPCYLKLIAVTDSVVDTAIGIIVRVTVNSLGSIRYHDYRWLRLRITIPVRVLSISLKRSKADKGDSKSSKFHFILQLQG